MMETVYCQQQTSADTVLDEEVLSFCRIHIHVVFSVILSGLNFP